VAPWVNSETRLHAWEQFGAPGKRLARDLDPGIAFLSLRFGAGRCACFPIAQSANGRILAQQAAKRRRSCARSRGDQGAHDLLLVDLGMAAIPIFDLQSL